VTDPPVRTALVTGASQGIGAKIAEGLAREGWNLTISARNEANLQATADILSASRATTVQAVPADMAVPEDVSRLVCAHQDRFDSLDALILNAGMGSIGEWRDFPIRRLDALLRVNVRGPYQLVQESLPLLLKTAASRPRGAKVIAVASMTGIAGEPLNSAYGASKAALISLCETLSTEYSELGVSGCAVCPGYADTEMVASLHEQVAPSEMIPISDVAEVVIAMTRLSKAAVAPMVAIGRPGNHLWRA
jgi:NAD(P)-dependent dehydrogenase (short-subunit alcohol dehydrogenase family)